jgi:hypothetical protein
LKSFIHDSRHRQFVSNEESCMMPNVHLGPRTL